MIGAFTDSDKYVHSDEWIGYSLDTVFCVYLDSSTLANLKVHNNITFVGQVSGVETGAQNAISNQIRIKFENAYLINDNVTSYTGKDRLGK